uniref:Transmembrane protein 211 n=1 Tax=Gopherus agassizii TaxID=38772 RepID=A0A452GRA9_9SAUR
MAFGLLVYPFGLSSATMKKFCENSSIYNAGDCQIGWGYMLAIVGVMLSITQSFGKRAEEELYVSSKACLSHQQKLVQQKDITLPTLSLSLPWLFTEA